MPGTRRPVPVLVALLLAASALATPARSGSPQSHPLDRSLTVRAAISSSVLLELIHPTPYRLTTDDSSDITIEGDGRVVAAALQAVEGAEPTNAAVVARFNGCDAPGCSPEPDAPPLIYVREGTGAPPSEDGRPTLAAGLYRLSILTDGAPATVRLRLGGTDRPGTDVATTTTADSAVVPAEGLAAVPGVPVAWSGGATITLASANTLLLGFFQQDTPGGTVAGAVGSCHFRGTDPLLGIHAPGCPFHPGSGSGSATGGSVGTELLTIGGDERARLATFMPASQGVQEAGFWSLRAGLTTTPFAVFAHLRLD